VLGWTYRDTGTVKPSGRSGLGMTRSATTCPLAGLVVSVVALAVVRAAALRDFGAAWLIFVPTCGFDA
jgi:hypothetical protein